MTWTNFNLVAMKKIYTLVMLVASFAIAMTSCQTSELADPELQAVEYVFALGNADDTKATIGESSVLWTTGDKVGTFAATSVNKYSTVTAPDGENPASISIYAPGGLAVNDMIYCYYPYNSGAGNDQNSVQLSVPVDQTEKDAMPMASIPYKVTEASGDDRTPYSGLIKFVNLGSVVELNVYSETASYAEEKIERIEFQADQAIAGTFNFDLASVDYSDPSTLEISGYSENTVTYTPSEPLTVGTSKEEATKVNLVVAPGSYTGKVVVYTDKATYTYPITSAKQFNRSVVKPLGLNLRANVRGDLPTYAFALAYEIEDGDEIIFASGIEGDVSVMGVQTDNNRDAVENVATQGGVIVYTTDMAMFTVGKGSENNTYFTFLDNGTKGYLYAASNSANHLKTQNGVDINAEWEVLISNEGASITATGSSNRNVMQYNAGSTLFSCYASASQKPVHIYKKTTDTAISAKPSQDEVSYEAGTTTIVYTIANPSGATAIEAGTSVTVTAHDEVNRTITISYPENTTGAERTLSVSIKNNGKTKVVEIVQKPAPVQLVMNAVTATPSETSIYYSWTAVTGASGYEVKTTGDWTEVAGTSYTYTELTANTSYTVQFRAVGDGLNYTTSEAVSCTAKTTAVGSSVYYEKVTEITSGKKYLLVAEYNGSNYVFNSSAVGSETPGIDIKDQISENRIASTDVVDTYAVTITSESEGYKILLSTGKYLVINNSTSSNGNLTSNTTGEIISATIKENKVLFASTNRATRGLLFRSNSGKTIYKNYAITNATTNGYVGYLTLYELQEN